MLTFRSEKNYTMKKLALSILLLLSVLALNAQVDAEYEELFEDADFYYFNDEYIEALPYLLQLVAKDPENANINYKIGDCYLKTLSKGTSSIPYLEKAVLNTTTNYKEGNINEKKAPQEAIIYLADAYFQNNQVEKAVEYYERFKKELHHSNEDYKELINITERKIETCKNTLLLESTRIDFKSECIEGDVNTKLDEFQPTVNANEDLIFYSSRQLFYDGVFYSEKKDGKWMPPTNYNFAKGITGDLQVVSVSPDGKTQYFYREDKGVGNIYVSQKTDSSWTDLQKLDICTRFNETFASVSEDGKTLYFTSNRNGGFGGLDIYKATLSSDGKWDNVENLGPTINTFYNETYPVALNNGKMLYFSSAGHYNMGGLDVFRSDLKDGKWTKPTNLGSPLNTTGDDYLFPLKNGTVGYTYNADSDCSGRSDIIRCEFKIPEDETNFIVTGLLTNADPNFIFYDGITATVIDSTGKNIIHPTAVDANGKFSFRIAGGKYTLSILHDGKEKLFQPLELPVIFYEASKRIEIPVRTTDGLLLRKSIPETEKIAENEIVATTKTENAGTMKLEGKVKNVLFGFDLFTADGYDKNLSNLANYLKANPEARIEIGGYADLQGSAEYNKMLTKKRAEFVKSELIKKGAPEATLSTKGYGQENQVSKNLTPESRKYNRRAEFKVIKQGTTNLIIEPLDIPAEYKL